MRLEHTAAKLGLLLAFASGTHQANAEANASSDACSSAYTKGQEDRLAGRLFAAREAFTVCAAATCPSAVAADCKHWRAEVETDLPTVRLEISDTKGAPIPNVQLFADGVRLTAAALREPVILEAGPHTLRFEAKDFRPIEVERALRPTDRELEVAVVMHRSNEPLAPPVKPREGPSTAQPPLPALPVALASVGVVTLGGALYFGLSSHRQYEDLKASCAPYCDPSDADSVRSKALVSDVLLLVSTASFGAAAWLYFGASRAQPPAAAVSIAPSEHGAGVRLRVAF